MERVRWIGCERLGGLPMTRCPLSARNGLRVTDNASERG